MKMRRLKQIRKFVYDEPQRVFGHRFGIEAAYICTAEKYGIMSKNHLQRIADGLGYADDPKTLLDEVEIFDVAITGR